MIYTHARKTALRNIPPVISSQSTHCAALIWFVEFAFLLSTIISYVLQQEIYGSERDFHSILAFWRSVKPFSRKEVQHYRGNLVFEYFLSGSERRHHHSIYVQDKKEVFENRLSCRRDSVKRTKPTAIWLLRTGQKESIHGCEKGKRFKGLGRTFNTVVA
ncbi:unnamed protein product [Porites lobata]|uniref:Uncharacterized protein n=1 Tax=Porites lobata TaxID=104759 RepID=A0ABN8PIY5_9CNID|nr:unnamed protein product [Porites lobata]